MIFLLLAADPWFSEDKLKHLCASYILTVAAGEAGLSPAEASGLCLGVGVSKELWDMKGGGDPSWRDLAWDLAGVALGFLVLEQFKR